MPTSLSLTDKMIACHKFDTDPAVFSVSVTCTDHTSGFTARAQFRTDHSGSCLTDITALGDTAEGAVDALYKTLKEKFVRCPACGQPIILKEE